MKTNAMRILDAHKVNYKIHDYSHTDALSGKDVAEVLNENPHQVFKTLVAVGKSKQYYVFLIPVLKVLDLKKSAKILLEKSIDLVPHKMLLSLTGYVHGGCSPFGMKKQFKTYCDTSILEFNTVMISGGKIGLQIELPLKDICQMFAFEIRDLCE